jgi:hypothetical protein
MKTSRLLASGTAIAFSCICVLNGYAQAPDPAPPNDNIANATAITGASGSVTGDNTTATAELTDTDGYGKSVWWAWTAPAGGGLFRFSATGVDVDMVLEVRDSNGQVGHADNRGDDAEQLRITAVGGEVYTIGVDDVNGVGSSLTLTWSQIPEGTLPVMAYDLRTVYSDLGHEFDFDLGEPMFDDNGKPVFYRSVETQSAIVLRGRKETAFVESGVEYGPAVVIYLYSEKEGKTVIRYYDIVESETDPDFGGGCRSSLVRYSAKSIQEDLKIGGEAGNDFSGFGMARSQALYKGGLLTVFATKLNGSEVQAEAYQDFESDEQGTPSPGFQLTTAATLTYNSKHTARVKDATTLSEAETILIDFLRSKAGGSYISRDEAFPSDTNLVSDF